MQSRYFFNGLGSIQNQSAVERDDFQTFDPAKEYDRTPYINGTNGTGGGDENGGSGSINGGVNGNNDGGTIDSNNNNSSNINQFVTKQASDLGMKDVFNKYKIPIAAGFGGILLIALLK